MEPTNLGPNVLQHKDFVKPVGKNVGNKNLDAGNALIMSKTVLFG